MLRPKTDRNWRETMKREPEIVTSDLESPDNLFERCRRGIAFFMILEARKVK
jgi:hypothetical protein